MEEYAKSWGKLASGLEETLVSQLHGETSLVEEFVREQLYSGVDGNEDRLVPRYSEDPYFKETYGKDWKMYARSYRKWKKKIQAPARSYLGFRPRAADTPNLIIRGDFYSSITAKPTRKGVKVVSKGVSFAADIEAKYGTQIYRIGNKAKRHYINHYMLHELREFIKWCGLL